MAADLDKLMAVMKADLLGVEMVETLVELMALKLAVSSVDVMGPVKVVTMVATMGKNLVVLWAGKMVPMNSSMEYIVHNFCKNKKSRLFSNISC